MILWSEQREYKMMGNFFNNACIDNKNICLKDLKNNYNQSFFTKVVIWNQSYIIRWPNTWFAWDDPDLCPLSWCNC